MNLSHLPTVRRAKWALLGVALAGLAWNGLRAADLAGWVVDARNGKPVEGAYVLAVYTESGGTWFGHSSRWCVRTAGMLTAQDGRFSLPAGKSNRVELHVIKEGFVENQALSTYSHGGHWYQLQSERDAQLFLEPMVVGGQRSRYVECERPATRADVDANIAYLKLFEREEELNGLDAHVYYGTRQAIMRFEKMK